MKNAIKLFGIIALIAVIGFSMAACGEEENDDGGLAIPAAYRNTVWTSDFGSTITFTSSSTKFNVVHNEVEEEIELNYSRDSPEGWDISFSLKNVWGSDAGVISFKKDGTGVRYLNSVLTKQ